MEEYIKYISDNKEWIFSGIGVAVVCLFINNRFRAKHHNIKITTHGNKSPGYVAGDYKDKSQND